MQKKHLFTLALTTAAIRYNNCYTYFLSNSFFQFTLGFFTFVVLLCCRGATAVCRLRCFAPIHAALGLCTFTLAIATCLTGLQQRADFTIFNNNGFVFYNKIVYYYICVYFVFRNFLLSANSIYWLNLAEISFETKNTNNIYNFNFACVWFQILYYIGNYIRDWKKISNIFFLSCNPDR